MRIAHIELVGGASGNMLLGALIDAGADAAAVERALRTIPVDGWALERRRVQKRGIAATYVDFGVAGEDGAAGEATQHGHHLDDILDLIERSGLTDAVKVRAAAIYRRLGEAEAHVHGVPLTAIHFHEVGQIDAVLDVAGVCVALDLLGIERLTAGVIPVGRGEIVMQHGRYPNPPPATLELLRGRTLVAADLDGELVTTTAAAILAELAAESSARPPLRVERIGYGAGRRDAAVPNVTRIVIGEAAQPAIEAAPSGDDVVVLETNIDDMSPQAFELAFERLFAAGAHDVWTVPIGMKKQRPGVLLAALAPPERAQACAAVMLRETTSLGVRMRREQRIVLEREIVTHLTPLGTVRVKYAHDGDRRRATLEYDDVARIARERGLPFATVAADVYAALEETIRA